MDEVLHDMYSENYHGRGLCHIRQRPWLFLLSCENRMQQETTILYTSLTEFDLSGKIEVMQEFKEVRWRELFFIFIYAVPTGCDGMQSVPKKSISKDATQIVYTFYICLHECWWSCRKIMRNNSRFCRNYFIANCLFYVI